MGTRSTIAVEHQDGSVSQIYCHWDGYLDCNGRILLDHYSDQSLLEAMINLGDLSSLGSKLKHTFDDREEDVCTFYGRDRGETDIVARRFQNYNDYRDNAQFEEYNYIFRKGEWFVQADNQFPVFVSLSEAFEITAAEAAE